MRVTVQTFTIRVNQSHGGLQECVARNWKCRGRVSKLAITLRWPISGSRSIIDWLRRQVNHACTLAARRERKRVRERDYFAEWWPPWIYFGRHRMGCGKPDSELGDVGGGSHFLAPRQLPRRPTDRMHSHTLSSCITPQAAVVNSRHMLHAIV